jgi:hypothetical protein
MLDNEYEEKMQRRVYEEFFPVFISHLLSNGILDRNRLDDKEYIIETVMENIDLLEDIRIQVVDYHVFIDGMKSEINHSRFKTAIVLGGTCIEHIMNYFYQDVLSTKFGLEQGDINKAIGLIKLSDKIGWFYKVATKSNLPVNLIDRILQIISIRNKIVHYQAIPAVKELNSGSHEKLNEIIESFDISSIIETINELEAELEVTSKALWPEIYIANTVFERLFK